MTKVLMLLVHNTLPREEHLEAVYHIFSYLKGHENSRLVFDAACPDMYDRRFTAVDWSDFYPDAANKLPPGMPEPRGMPIKISCFVDTDHAGNLATRCSQTGITYIHKQGTDCLVL